MGCKEKETMTAPIEPSKLTPAQNILGEDAAETAALQEMLARAEKYLRSFRWCPQIAERYLAFGVGGVLALFLFKLEHAVNGTDQWLWVVEGDLPSAYFVVDEARDASSALSVYCDMMEEWAQAVESNKPLGELFPVSAAPTMENAALLQNRIAFIRERILPTL
jgi:hypothetical protein